MAISCPININEQQKQVLYHRIRIRVLQQLYTVYKLIYLTCLDIMKIVCYRAHMLMRILRIII